MLYCWGPNFADFDGKGVIFTNFFDLTVFSRISRISPTFRNFVRERHKFIASARLQLKFVRSPQKLRKVGEIREKTVKSKKFVKITPFSVKIGKILVPNNPTISATS